MSQRSPTAELFDPPAHHAKWTTEQPQAAPDFCRDLQSRLGLSPTAWHRMLWHGGLHINRQRVGPAQLQQLHPGEHELALLPSLVPAQALIAAYWFAREPPLPTLQAENLCYVAESFVAVNKPPWLPMQATRASCRISLEFAVAELLGCTGLHAVHRLDRMTSGVVLFARNSATCAQLSRQFAARRVSKEYLAWVWPAPTAQQWQVEGYIAPAPHPSHAYYHFCATVVPGGRWSSTSFEVVATQGERALIRARPLTGRTHQIRVHLAASGSAIVGDFLYGGGYEPGAPWSSERLQLHAAALSFDAPEGSVGAGPLHIRAPTPIDWCAA